MKTILIIEDNNDIRESTAEILELSGFKVLQAAHGKIGVDVAIQQIPDLILCDIMMPELDGYGVLYMLSKNPATYAIPFIFLTAKAERVDFRKGMEMGADDYLTKPFDDVELLNAIESRLSKQQKQESYYSKTLSGLEKLAANAGKGIEELKALINSRKVRQIKKKQVLFYDGDDPQGLYIVLAGNVKTFKLAEDGRELTTGLYKTDDFLGINALLLNEPFTETAEAIEDSAVCMLGKDAILDILNRYPDVNQKFFKILANDIREKENQLMELAYHSVRKRMAQTLLRLSKQSATPANFKISRDELASLAGIATETVSRTLTDFKDEGLIEKKGSNIEIIDITRLGKMKN
ncbi:response regulator [Mucilaginibacter terrae]|uniref:CRP-like cAMP-binding protein/CheY-like chemotaxis protein n=1 Tax=Mucilaginibacter terrae TaxID=1955052 RepID=A0ABU3GPL8_9SPHI|nr:response regulator [Mucilaginibacter terrae]MDT3401471.1 CRP-like cAMP-binding protein/CheY-like chemotaxis protein [Mucilaginibacter terrae]